MLLKSPTKDIWAQSVSRELGRLAQGFKQIKGNDAIEFIPKSQVPPKEKSNIC